MSTPRICLCALVLLCSAGTAGASLIDSFNAGSQTLFVWPGAPTASNQANPGTGTAIGGYRDITLQWISGDLDFANVLASSPTGKFSFTEGTAEGKVDITWDGANTPSVLSYLLGANLTTGGDDEFRLVVDAVTGSGVPMTMTVYTDATHASAYSTTVPAGTTGNVFVPYASFAQVAAGPANFANVGAIVLEFNGTGHVGSDITLGLIQTQQSVPEPSTLALSAIGALVLGLVSRRRKA
jgi:hypothetical protein